MIEAVLYDSSVWVDFLNQRKTPQTLRLESAIQTSSDDVLTCPTVVQEVLQGIRDDLKHARIKRSLMAFTCLQSDPLNAAIEAADLYRMLRKKGITIRKANDCLIARYAIQAGVMLCHADDDFDRIAEYSSLGVIR